MNDKQIELKDVLPYRPETYLKDDEILLLQNTFKDNPHLIKALRKLLLPTLTDSDLPIEEFNKDVWLVGIDWLQIPVEQIKPLIVGRMMAIKFILGGLIQLKVLAQSIKESSAERALREKKNSNK